MNPVDVFLERLQVGDQHALNGPSLDCALAGCCVCRRQMHPGWAQALIVTEATDDR